LTAARLNGDFDPLYACLDPATGGLEDTNVKSGAKIVCTDRAHTVTGVWTFTTAPVLPAGSVADSKLTSNVMLKTTYDTDTDGRVGLAVDSDTVDGSHAAAFAAAAHNHNLNDLAEKSYNSLADKPVITGYALSVGASVMATVSDGATYYFGTNADIPATTGGSRRVYIPKAGTIKTAYVCGYSPSGGTSETVTVYLRLNNTSDTLIKTGTLDGGAILFDNAALSIAVVAGNFIEIKMVCPTWVTNPTDVRLSGTVYIE
jgi:hypothetical protein